jgi:hypothetical protein
MGIKNCALNPFGYHSKPLLLRSILVVALQKKSKYLRFFIHNHGFEKNRKIKEMPT